MMHPEALDKNCRAILPLISGFRGFYLAGGTALALQIGHRISVDLDFFSPKPIPRALLEAVRRAIGKRSFRVSVNNSDELTVFADGVKLTFLYYPFPRLLPFARYGGVSLLSIKEIAATKAYTIGRRGSYKDYVDIYFVLKDKYASLQAIIKLAEKKYGDAFNSRLFLEQLVYFEDIKDEEIVFLKKKPGRPDLIRMFEQEIKNLHF